MECSGIRNLSGTDGAEGAAARRGSWAQRLTALAAGLGLVAGMAGLVVGQVSGVDGPEGASEAGFSIFGGDRSAVRAEGVTAPESGGSVDLALQLLESRDPVVGGTPLGDLVHTLQVENLGPDAATGIEITVSLPQLTGVTVDSVTPGIGRFDASSGVWMLASLASGEQAELQIAMTVGAEAEVGSDAIVTSAQVTAVVEGDLEPGNDEASVGTLVLGTEGFNFSFVFRDVDPLEPGSPGTFEVLLDNNGPGMALGYLLTIEVPDEIVVESMTTTNGWICTAEPVTGTTVVCHGPDIDSGGRELVTLMEVRAPEVPAVLDFKGRIDWAQYDASTETLAPMSFEDTELITVTERLWQAVGGPEEARTRHTATLLSSNKILVAGGKIVSGAATSSAEEFDPQTLEWSSAATLLEARYDHAALLLPAGGVLVTGGRGQNENGDSVVLQSVELYDVALDEWSQMPSLQVARHRHTLTLLADGSVLAVGGLDGDGQVLSSVEMLMAGADDWVLTSELNFARSYHTATLLRSLDVLVTGGRLGVGNYLAEAEVFSAASQSWRSVQPMSVSRSEHSATLLANGSLLVEGGTSASDPLELYNPAPEEWLLAAENDYYHDSHSATLLPSGRILITEFVPTQIYDPQNDSWITYGTLEAPRKGHTATLLPGGQVVIVGGVTPQGNLTQLTEIFGEFAVTQYESSQLENPRVNHQASTLANGKVLMTGGRQRSSISDEVFIFDPQDEYGWVAGGSLLNARQGHSQTLLEDGRVLVSGGHGNALVIGEDLTCFSSSSAEIRNLDGSWLTVKKPNECKYFHAATRLADGTVLISGGESPHPSLIRTEYHGTSEIFDPACDCFQAGADIPASRSRHTATLLASGHVILVGGENGERLQDAHLYDPTSRTWEMVAPMSAPRSRHAGVLLPSGKVLVAGGSSLGAEIYDPISNSWRPTGDQPLIDSDHPTLTLLPSGNVLMLGAVDESERKGASVYDPIRDLWSQVPGNWGRKWHSSSLLNDGRVLVLGGGLGEITVFENPEFLEPQAFILDPISEQIRRPTLTDWPTVLSYNEDASMQITGTGFRGVSEGASGTTQNSSTAFPLIHLQALNGGPSGWLEAAEPHPITPGEDFWDGSMTLDIAHIPPIFHPGWHRLTVFANGVPSQSEIVQLECSLEINKPQIAAIFDAEGNEIEVLEDPRVPVGGRVRFEITSHGGRNFQWQRNYGNSETPDWRDLDGVNESSYLTQQLIGAESGSQFRVRVSSGCMEETSEIVTFTIDDSLPPVVEVVSPGGGEHWPLSTATAPNHEQVVYDVSDATTWVCELRAELIYSNDQGDTWHVAPANVEEPENAEGELPRDLGAPGCSFGQRILGGALSYAAPLAAPSGQSGSLYKIRLRAIDQAGNEATAESQHPFFILPPNDQSVRTLILFHPERLGVDCGAIPEPEVCRMVRELAQHPSVVGRVIDLGANEAISRLYEAWDNADQQAEDSGTQGDRDTANLEANKVLFKSGGIHELLRGLAGIFEGLESILLLGGDHVIPMARVSDDSGLLGEEAYTEGADPDLQPNGSTVGRAIDARIYLSDDPLATLAQPVNNASDLYREGIVFLPDIAIGRLVETPEQIVAAIQTFQQHEGVLDLTARQNKVLVTGYDFLTDSARIIEEKWRCSLDPDDDTADGEGCDPEEGTEILLPNFGRTELEQALCGDSEPYALINLNGHANHYQEGVPGAGGHTDIQGVSTERLASETLCGGQPLDLDGAVIYAVGCHGGLPVPDDSESDVTLDLPQVFLQRGAMAYLANTGYGWGLKEGIGYSERLMEIFTDQLRVGDSVTVGRAMLDAKKRYFQEARKLDAYGIKTLMQWTTFGFPMARIHTGLGGNEDMPALRPIEGPARESDALTAVEQLGPVTVRRSWTGAGASGVGTEGTSLPSHMDRIRLTLEFSEDSYVKRTSEGERVTDQQPGCPSSNGCYYTLNGLGERGTGDTDRPIQPYALLDSGLGGTSQHGVLWLGGKYKEEADWRPVFAELISNVADTGSNHGSAPQLILGDPIETPIGRRDQGNICRVSDLETSTMVVPAGEVRMSEPTDNSGPVVPSDYDIQRRYNEIYMETFYFNNSDRPSDNCDRQGPLGLASGQGPFDGRYHETNGSTLSWQVPVTDEAGVWRVVVVYDVQRDSEPQDGEWQHLELTHDPVSQSWVGERSFASGQTVTYVIQAVDNRGNVSWLRHLQGAADEEDGAGQTLGEGGPNSGVDIEHPGTVPVSISATADLAISMAANPNPVEVVEDFELTLSVELKDEGPATSVRVEVGILPGSEVIAAGDADWECSILGDLLTCDGPNFVQGGLEVDEIRVQLMPPPLLGTAAITATVNLAEQDLQGDDNRTTVLLEVVEEDVIPSVVALTSAARVEEGTLGDGAAVDVALTQLRVAFNEPVQEADDVDNFLLAEAGLDGIWQTQNLALGLAGDDIGVSFGEVTYEPETHTTVLGMSQALPLPDGQYLLLVGRGIYDTSFQFLDGDGDGAEGGDFQRSWTVQRRHLAFNPNFDRSLAGWFEEEGTEDYMTYGVVDAEGVPSSGSLVLEHLGGPSAVYSVGQCIPVEPGKRLAFGGRLYLDPEGSWQTVQFDAEVWSTADCGDELLDVVSNVVPLEGASGDEPRWQIPPLGFIDVPDDGQSVLISLTAAAEDNAGPAVVRLDNVEVFSVLFADGFETGDISGWSRSVGDPE